MTSDVRAGEVRAGAAAARNQARRGGRAARESQRLSMLGRWALPFLIGALVLVGWEVLVRVNEIPYYIIPTPTLIALSLWNDWGTLSGSLMVTLQITFAALAVATIGGVGLAILFNQSRLIEFSLFPYAVILQVTPIIAIAPLILIYVKNVQVGLLICAWIVAFFPILSNTTLGLNSADHNLVALFRLYGANRWQTLWQLRLPGAMPYFLGALKISGGLSLIGAVRCRVRGRHRRHRLGPRLPHPRGELPVEHPAHVRRAVPDLAFRHHHLHGVLAAEPPAAAQVARKRDQAGRLRTAIDVGRFTPHPDPPPQGGREAGAATRISLSLIAEGSPPTPTLPPWGEGDVVEHGAALLPPPKGGRVGVGGGTGK